MKVLRVINWPWRFFKRRSWLGRIGLLFLLVITAFFGYRMFFQSNKMPEYEVELATRDSIVETVSETGNVTGSGVTPIYSTTTGVIDQLNISNGSYVQEDQVLFTVKSTATQQQKDTALANYLSAKNSLEAAKATQLTLQAQMFNEWDQFKELAEGDEYENDDGSPRNEARNLPEFHVPEKEWLAAEAQYKNQQQVISQAQVNASAAWQAYQATQDSEVKAVLGGVVQNLSVTKGSQVIAASIGTTTVAPVLLMIDQTAPTTIQIAVSETDAVKIEALQKASVEFDALPERVFEAVVDRVDLVATPNQGIVNYNVYINLTEADQKIRKGMTATVDIVVAEKEGVLTVPSSAVKPYEGKRAVRVVGENGEVDYLPVEVGSRGNGRTEILSGIDEGQEVIVALGNDQIERSSGGFFGN